MQELMQIAQQVGPEVVLIVAKAVLEGMQQNPEQLQQVLDQIAQMAQQGGGQQSGGQPSQDTNEALFGSR